MTSLRESPPAPPLPRALTLPLLPLSDDGIQPLLLLLRRLGHADKPLVLGRVVDLPAVGDSVAIAVIIRWQRQEAKVGEATQPHNSERSPPLACE